ncbi:MAG TPA: type 1 glutamine amidotransferase [Solirubrobacteraceae bacterium]|jgi:GMP synthase (glutamine-hydrolysing)|nr:type 1 glutamine amidotransferase [Solirubrobacteraceae bacterium]
MRALTIVHEKDAGPGIFNDVLAASAADADTWLVAEEPEPPAPAREYDAIFSFGGSVHPDQEQSHPWLKTEKRFLSEALRGGVPLLGVCLGAELIAEVEGTVTRRMSRPEIGWYGVKLTSAGAADPVIGPIGQPFPALEWHSYEVALPSRAAALARSANCLQAFRIGDVAWGIQFHAEVTADDFQHWLDDYASDEDFVEEGIEPDAIAVETEHRIAPWHDLGRGICERFLEVASSR